MPNWCENALDITGTSKSIKRLVEDLRENEYKWNETIAPHKVTKDEYDKNWRALNIDNWGTKWEVGDTSTLADTIEDSYEEGNDYLSLWFDTAWSPNVEVSEVLAKKYGVEVTHRYEEQGCELMGRVFIAPDGEVLEHREYDSEVFSDVLDFHGEVPYNYAQLTNRKEEAIAIGDMLHFNSDDGDPVGVLISDDELLLVGEERMIPVGRADGEFFVNEDYI
jgi:hypothetical protein